MGVAVDYSWTKGRSDLVAGLTVAAVALPQGIAYALIGMGDESAYRLVEVDGLRKKVGS